MENRLFRHDRIDLDTDRNYILERHCRINYECDCPWARTIPYAQYRLNWFADRGQQEGFLAALEESMKDARTIAEIIKTQSGEPVAYLWAPFHGEDAAFLWAEVQDIHVEEAFRNRGIALRLMAYAEEEARRHGARVIRSGTGCENTASIRMHERAGYYQYRYEYEKVLNES